ncbi:MAG: FtsH protease activity modulator HflK [Pseudohongiellaceae bacterium]|jgi:modulator of FtsH protease HflK
MAWNEPDNNDRKQDPWGTRPGKKDQGPPDLDKMADDMLKKLGGIFGGGKRGGSSGGGDLVPGGLVAIVLAIALGLYALSGVYTVNEQERGVVLRLGRALDNVVLPGLHWNPPLIDSVNIINVTRVYDQRFNNTMLTEDDNIVDISMTVQYVITDAHKYFLEVEDPEISLQQAAESALRHVVGGSKMDDVINTGREVLAVETRDRLQGYLDAYGTGITVNQLNIAQSQPPPQVRAAFDDVIKASEDNQSTQNEARRYASQVVPEARGAARRQMEEASAYKEQVIARAQGEAERFERLLVEYKKAPEVTRQRLYLDAMQDVMSNSSKVMIDVEGGNNMMYLPLDQLLQRARRPEGSAQGAVAPQETPSFTVTPQLRTPAREVNR